MLSRRALFPRILTAGAVAVSVMLAGATPAPTSAETARPVNVSSPVAGASRDFLVGHRYLNLPIKNGAPKRKVTLLVDGTPIVTNEVELADATPDWWAFVDVDPWRGHTVTVHVDALPPGSAALSSIDAGDSPEGAEPLYRESLRPQLHFSARRGWMNDPNGLVFYRGEYHLFFQHNPYGWEWGNMHWGHATSRDLVHWEEHAEALSPDSFGPMFSGSAVVDVNNTSGLGAAAGRAPLVLVYTAFGPPAVQCLASSVDGRRFTKLDRNPIVGPITPNNRDPKVFWHAPTRRWVMVLYLEKPASGRTTLAGDGPPALHYVIQLLTSPNLRDWTPTSTVEGGVGDDRLLYECPDLFELPLDGDPANPKWILTGANGEYVVGRFDGREFTPETKGLRGNFGPAFYAPQTFSDLPDGRRIQIAWGRVPSPGMPFNQLQLFPCQLGLRQTADGPRLTRMPISELTALRDGPDQSGALSTFRSELIELRAEFDVTATPRVQFEVRGATITYDRASGEVAVNDVRAPAPARDGIQRLAVYVDRTVIEVFASDGLVYLTVPFIAGTANQSVALDVPASALNSLRVFRLKSIW